MFIKISPKERDWMY